MKKTAAILSLLLAALLALNGCKSAGSSGPDILSSETSNTETTESSTTVNTSDMFTNNDMEIGYDAQASTIITLSGDSASATSNAVKISGSTVTITDEGVYIFQEH